ncbi:MAG: GNAT family N-acetyltransferase [Candidatus Bilamarchaeaceae archaeon]
MIIEVVTAGLLVRSPYRRGLMRAYKRVFEGKPWYESWPMPLVEKEFRSLAKQIPFGYIGLEGEKPIAFIIAVNRAIRDPVMWNGIYIAEFGVIPEMQCRGLGTILAQTFVEQFRSEGPFMFRTLNPVVPLIFRKLCYVECMGCAKDDSYAKVLLLSKTCQNGCQPATSPS